mgnify:CR=1 FL=1
MTNPASEPQRNTPVITGFRVIPVAGRDGMLLNLSGAHAPFFTRNLVVLTDNSGRRHAVMVPDVCGNVSVLGARGEKVDLVIND